MRTSILILCAAVISRGSLAAGEGEEFLKDAQSKSKAGKFLDADKTFEAALAKASAEADNELTSRILVARVDNLRAWRAADSNDKEVFAKLAAAYQQLADPKNGATAVMRQRAVNNLGVLLITEKKYAESVKAFDSFPDPTDEPHVFLANYARALEGANQPTVAVKKYLESLAKNPKYQIAAEGAIALLKAEPATIESRLAAKAVLESPGLPVVLVGTSIYDLLGAWPDAESASILLPYLVRYLARAQITLDQFQSSEKARLNSLARHPIISSRIKELTAIYDDLTFAVGAEESVRIGHPLNAHEIALPAWKMDFAQKGEAFRRDFATVLKVAGDGFASLDQKEDGAEASTLRAIRRYVVAFSLDQSFTEAALSIVTLLGRTLGINRESALLNQFTDAFLDEKLHLLKSAKTKADFLALNSLHVVLATIFDSRGKWGSETESRSAIFQWKAAIEDEQVIRQKIDPNFPVSPRLRLKLADAYLNGKFPDNAAKFYDKAAELYLDLGRPELARKVVTSYKVHRASNSLAASAIDERISHIDQLIASSVVRKEPAWETSTSHPIHAIAFDSANHLVIGGESLTIWDWRSRKQLVEKVGDVLGVTASAAKEIIVAWGPLSEIPFFTGDVLMALTADGSLKELWRQEMREVSRASITVSMDGSVAGSLGREGEVILWDGMTGKRIGLTAESGWHRLAISADGKTVLCTGRKGVAAYSVSESRIRYMTEPTGEIAGPVGSSADNKLFAVGFADGMVRTYFLDSGKESSAFKAHSGAIQSVLFHPDSRILATFGTDQTVRLWDTQSKMELVRIGHPLPVFATAFSPDGKALAISAKSSEGGLIRLWELHLAFGQK